MRTNVFRIVAATGALATAISVAAAVLQLRAPKAELPLALAARPRTGTELVLVLLVSSECAASQLAGLPEAVARITDSLSARAKREGLQFHTLAVALDVEPVRGVEFLRSMGNFDEIASGRGWFGLGSVVFMVRDQAGAMALPQVVLLRRELVVDAVPSVSRDQIVARRVGADEIAHLADNLRQLVLQEPRSDQ